MRRGEGCIFFRVVFREIVCDLMTQLALICSRLPASSRHTNTEGHPTELALRYRDYRGVGVPRPSGEQLTFTLPAKEVAWYRLFGGV